MIPGIKKRSDILGWISLLVLLIGILNALEYFFAGKNYLAKYEGEVADVMHDSYKQTSKRGVRYYTKTVIWLKEFPKSFRLTERSEYGGYVPVEKGEVIQLYVKKWYQHFYIFSYKSDIYYVERDGKLVYNNLSEWKGTAFAIMCFAGGLSLFLFLIYLDLSKNISLELWFQRKVLMNRNYRK